MAEQTIELNIPFLTPEIKDDHDHCLDRLEMALQHQKGILRAHVEHAKTPAQLCIHYDPNLISLATVQRLARQSGSEFTQQYRHKQIPFDGMDTADAATALTRVLERLPGMLHANVNYGRRAYFCGLRQQGFATRGH